MGNPSRSGLCAGLSVSRAAQAALNKIAADGKNFYLTVITEASYKDRAQPVGQPPVSPQQTAGVIRGQLYPADKPYYANSWAGLAKLWPAMISFGPYFCSTAGCQASDSPFQWPM